jgi:hypothetical protein
VASPPSPACLENRVKGKAKWMSSSVFLSQLAFLLRCARVAASCASGVLFSCRLAMSRASRPSVQARESGFGPCALPEKPASTHGTPLQCQWAGATAGFVQKTDSRARQNNQKAHTTSRFFSLTHLSAAAARGAQEGLGFLDVNRGSKPSSPAAPPPIDEAIASGATSETTTANPAATPR